MPPDTVHTTVPVPPGDLVLPAEVRPTPVADPTPRPGILLTGATGYLGAYLLRELLARTAGTVWCLVRAADDTAAATRLAARCAEVGVTPERTVAIAGDFTQPQFGLGPHRYRELAGKIGAVHHCGASVNMNDPYQLARIPNVQGTVEVLRFATYGPVKAVHHVSTMAVFIAARATGLNEIGDDNEPSVEHSGTFGYAASKCAAELLMRQAAVRGVPVTIHRPPFLPGDSATGAASATEPLTTLMKVCAQLRAAPETLPLVPVCAVDHAGRAIAALSATAPEPGPPQVFNLHDAAPLPLVNAVHALRRAGHEISALPIGDWLALLAKNRRVQPARWLYVMSEILPYMVQSTPAHQLPSLTPSQATPLLAAQGITAPPIDEAFLDRLTHHISPQPESTG